MPQTSDPSVEKKSLPRHLLLVEDYDALVIAIGSALRKFAPAHERHVVASIVGAEKVADEYRPELVLIDLDPPQRGVVQFIERLRVAHPTTRVLAMGCGTSREFGTARGGMAGIRFIEKPFDLGEFGKLTEELTTPTASGVGTIADIALADLVALECVTGSDVVLRIEAAGGRVGEVHFCDGQVVHAVSPGLLDVPAIEEMARWRRCRFAETERAPDAPRTIHIPWGPLLVELVRKVPPDEPAEVEPSVARRKRRKVAESGKKIVVVDDTELLLEFVEEILSAADPSLQITTAHTGTEGVRLAQLTRPDLVLLDYSLPDINGDEVCRRLLEDEETARIPIVMMSGHLAQMMATAHEYENVIDAIAKPFVSVDFVELVTRTLAKGPPKTAARRKKTEVVATPPSTSPREGNGISSSRNGGAVAEAVAPSPPPPTIGATPPPPPMPPPAAQPEPEPQPPSMAEPVAPPSPPAEPERVPEPPRITAPPPPPAPPALPRKPARLATAAPIAAPRLAPVSAPSPVPVTNGRTVLLGIALEPITMQLTHELKIGQIRARAVSRTVSLSFPPETFRFILSLQTGFDIESVWIDDRHQLQAIWLAPNRRPIELLKTSGRFNVDDVEIAPSRGLELMPDQATAMRVHMLAAFKVQSVALSPLFDVSHLVLTAVSRRVRVSLEASTEAPGSIFEIREVRAAPTSSIGELVLSPV
ncbi:MAG: response regulator [Chthoniobacterales bacterium]